MQVYYSDAHLQSLEDSDTADDPDGAGGDEALKSAKSESQKEGESDETASDGSSERQRKISALLKLRRKISSCEEKLSKEVHRIMSELIACGFNVLYDICHEL